MCSVSYQKLDGLALLANKVRRARDIVNVYLEYCTSDCNSLSLSTCKQLHIEIDAETRRRDCGIKMTNARTLLPESMMPLSPTTVSSPFGNFRMKTSALAIWSASVICSGVTFEGSTAP